MAVGKILIAVSWDGILNTKLTLEFLQGKINNLGGRKSFDRINGRFHGDHYYYYYFSLKRKQSKER